AGHDLVGQDMPISGPSGRKTAGQKLEPAVITREMSSINNTHRCPASIQIRISGHKQSAFITAVKSGPFIGLLAPPVHPSYSGTYGQTINTWATVNSSGIVFNYSGDQKDLLCTQLCRLPDEAIIIPLHQYYTISLVWVYLMQNDVTSSSCASSSATFFFYLFNEHDSIFQESSL
ncbi:hypothetical protein J6590_105151, partial [Homalodisca vitripennis]